MAGPSQAGTRNRNINLQPRRSRLWSLHCRLHQFSPATAEPRVLSRSHACWAAGWLVRVCRVGLVGWMSGYRVVRLGLGQWQSGNASVLKSEKSMDKIPRKLRQYLEASRIGLRWSRQNDLIFLWVHLLQIICVYLKINLECVYRVDFFIYSFYSVLVCAYLPHYVNILRRIILHIQLLPTHTACNVHS